MNWTELAEHVRGQRQTLVLNPPIEEPREMTLAERVGRLQAERDELELLAGEMLATFTLPQNIEAMERDPGKSMVELRAYAERWAMRYRRWGGK